MLSMKEIQMEANRYKMTSGWDAKRNIIRGLYNRSEDRKTDLTYFAECVGKSFEYVVIQGQIFEHREEKKARKYGKKINRQKIEKKAKENNKIIMIDEYRDEVVPATGPIEKLAAELFIEETKAPSYIREQQAWRSIRDQKGVGLLESLAIAAGVLVLLVFAIQNPTVALAAVAGIQSHRI
jgi:hypothetical protein